MLGTALVAIDTTIVSVALPTITGKLGGFSLYAWVGTAYILTSTIATPILGKFGDLFGRRRVVLAAISVFLLGSLLCGVSTSMGQLIASRAIQGLGGGGIQALTFAILGDLVSPRERGRYMGLYTGIYASAAVGGPLLGGWMIDRFAWEWIFLVNLPIGCVALAAIWKTLRVPFRRSSARIDVFGAALLSASLAALIVALERAKAGWTKPTVIGLLIAFCVLMIAFIAHERRTKDPIVPLELFRNRVVAIASAMGFLVGSMTFGAQAFLPLQFQDANFVGATRAGLYLAPLMFGVLIGSAVGGRLISRTGRYKIFPIIGLGCAVLGTVALSQLNQHWGFVTLFLPMLGIGMGAGSTYTTTSIATQNAIDSRQIGIGTATLTSLRSLGGALGLAVYGTLHSTVVRTQLARRVPRGALPSGMKVSALVREPAKIKALAEPIRSGVVGSITAATGRVFLAAIPIAILAFVLALLLPELALRQTSGLDTDKHA
jgi:EmrB/QacA subfamily drug resistance transporter